MFSYVSVPVVDMRQEATNESKVASQALFGEQIQTGQTQGEWISIMTPDGYSGWVKPGCFTTLPKSYPKKIEVSRLSSHVYSVADTEYGPILTLPFGSKLEILDDSDSRWIQIRLIDGRVAFIQKGDVLEEPFPDIGTFSKRFIGLPYTWGGRSSFGYDCSGFVQMLYHRLGIQLPRDSAQQFRDPRCKPIDIEKLNLGDLIFFGKSEEKIGHVGMCLEGKTFIHTSSRENKPYLRISHLSDREWSGHKEASYPFRAARKAFF
jgi:hypothetical protein